MRPQPYRGRFAPSPTGPLHFGSLVAAVASYADARYQGGRWLVRIEDVDQTRCSPAAERAILDGLKAHGMQWDESPARQSTRTPAYDKALALLADSAHAYRCNCSRKTISAMARRGPEGLIYPGTCRGKPPPANARAAWRLTVPDEAIRFDDQIVGRIEQNLAREVGDFVIRRVDGFSAYQLAVVVDDADQGITHIVRGADLLWSTPRQIWLQQLLGYPTPEYAHVPLVYGDNGHKLSKSALALPVDDHAPMLGLRAAWHHLGQIAPPANITEPNTFWLWATQHWQIEDVPRDRNLHHESTGTI